MAEALTFIAGTSDHLLIRNPRPLGSDSCRSHEEQEAGDTAHGTREFRDETVADARAGRAKEAS